MVYSLLLVTQDLYHRPHLLLLPTLLLLAVATPSRPEENKYDYPAAVAWTLRP